MTINFEENKMTDCDKCTEFKTDFPLIKPKFINGGREGIVIRSVDEIKKPIVKFLNEDWELEMNFNNYIIFTPTLNDFYINQKKINFGGYTILKNKKTGRAIFVLITYQLGNKTDNILKTVVDNAPNSNGKENAPNLNNFDMNEFFKHNKYYYSNVVAFNKEKVSGKEKIEIDKVLFNFDNKTNAFYNILVINSNLTISQKDLDLLKKKLSYQETKNSSPPKELPYNIIYKHEKSSWGSFSVSGSGKRDSKDDIIIDCNPVMIDKDGKEVKIKPPTPPSPEEQFKELMKNPYLKVIFGFIIVFLVLKIGSFIFEFAKKNNIFGKFGDAMARAKEKFKSKKSSLKNLNPFKGMKKGGIDYSRSKDPEIKTESDTRKNQEKEPLLDTKERSDTGNAPVPIQFKGPKPKIPKARGVSTASDKYHTEHVFG